MTPKSYEKYDTCGSMYWCVLSVSHVIDGPDEVWAEAGERLLLAKKTELKIVIASRIINVVALEFDIVGCGMSNFI